MRISRFDLLRYGKFTDKSIVLPPAVQDFHLIIGPNEAGKSTLRNALQDLFFGIETRSRYNFLYAHSEMRLGALIEQGESSLDFIRSKGRSKTLQNAAGTALVDNALLPFTGPVDRVFFDQMFGLNHARLLSGGQEILSASSDMGQLLFQAAAGIGSLGDIRDRLEAEANQLWAKRKSSDREYYAASTELEQAETALKQLTVRTKDWQAAQTQVVQLGDALGQSRDRYQALEQTRIQLERVRRVATLLTTLAALEQQHLALGTVVVLPENAGVQLAKAEQDAAMATQSLLLFEQQRLGLSEKIAMLQPDAALLARGPDIEALSALRQQLRTVAGDIAKREGEVQWLWQNVQEAVRQLGWPDEAEVAVTQRLPGNLLRTTLGSLLRRHDVLAQALATAQEARDQRQTEVKTIHTQMKDLSVSYLSVELLDGLATARALGDVATQEKQMATQIARLTRDVASATLGLGAWCHSPQKLLLLWPPTVDETYSLMARRSDLQGLAAATRERLVQAESEVLALALEITHYQAAHHPVTLAEVRHQRAARDASWQAIKSRASPLTLAAPGYEQAVAEADRLSDQRHDRAQAETELQAKLDRLQGLQQQVTRYTLQAQEHAQALAQLDYDWQTYMDVLGLVDMPLLKMNDWRAARERVLAAAAALVEAQAVQDGLKQRVTLASQTLAQALPALAPQVPAHPLSVWVLLADAQVTAATRARERREALATQIILAEASLPDLHQRLSQAQAALATWQAEWQSHLARAHLAPDTALAAVESALALFEYMHQQLQKIRDIQVNRIDLMRRDLQDFERMARSLAAEFAPALAQVPAEQVALQLEADLKRDTAVAQTLARLQPELAQASAQADAARQRLGAASASLTPLMQLSGTTHNPCLRSAIDRSDQQRQLNGQITHVLQQLLTGGDGLSRTELQAELAAIDSPLIAGRLSDLKLQIDAVVAQQNRFSAELNAAETELGKIAGQGAAARAEAQRQEALARMTNAVARYLKVHTAAKLLRWSIERFRESKQGPMLARASEVFAGLTGGAFVRLVVDYDSQPLKLSGQRASNELVAIDGMSEGTRDQLYLALRLAALELHLAQTPALPFIADDLFINYDDDRARAGLAALGQLSELTQVLFLSHHAHLVPVAQAVFGDRLNVVYLT
jgi:uncharacterized protein YhaN